MIVEAAILERVSAPLVVTELELDDPRRDEVLVRILASGICRSDLSYMTGKWRAPLPMVLGHEGAGVIEAVGEGVPESRVGEHVVLTFAPPCGRCRFCLEGRANLCLDAAACMDAGTMRDGTTRLHRGDERVHHLARVSSFANHAVVPASGAIPVTDRLEPGLACLLGCGVTTGVMSVTRRANVRPGDSVAVFGCGGVGLAAILGARLVSAEPLVAVDPLPAKREMALAMGATHAVDPEAGDPAEQVRTIAPGGVDCALEAIGIAAVAEQAFRSVRDGGTTVLIGQPAMGVKAGFDVYDATQFEHTILGSNLGGANPALHVPGLARLAASGTLDLAPLATHRMPLGRINEAVEVAASGAGGRVVIEL
jgi:S-(hydroxymethyl)glutathione dehydrogenase / alcohol dehydrogenase